MRVTSLVPDPPDHIRYIWTVLFTVKVTKYDHVFMECRKLINNSRKYIKLLIDWLFWRLIWFSLGADHI